jgi:hypothetical protein
MTPPPTGSEAVRPLPWQGRRRAARALSPRLQLALVAAGVLAVTVTGPLALRPTGDALGGLATRGLLTGTASLQSATCTDWHQWTPRHRTAALATLGVAATAPDPESRGATLDAATAYGVLERACSTPESASSVLYQVYNRAASFAPAATPVGPGGGFGTAAHR